ncbi:MAG: NAD-dependent deacylase [Cyclobacteriaceae bacterium]
MKKLVILSGAGVSAESGLKTFRDAGGLWEGHNVMDVATPEAWRANPELVLSFYNERRKQALESKPNQAHTTIADLEQHFEVVVITQNVDNLHEKAGSSQVIHLHGELFKTRSTVDESLVYDMKGWELNMGDVCEKGSQLRPHIVWFGEMVPMMEVAALETMKAEAFVVVGTSLQVYPAAGLVDYVPMDAPIFVVDPNLPTLRPRENVIMIEENAGTGMQKVKKALLEKYL